MRAAGCGRQPRSPPLRKGFGRSFGSDRLWCAEGPRNTNSYAIQGITQEFSKAKRER